MSLINQSTVDSTLDITSKDRRCCTQFTEANPNVLCCDHCMGKGYLKNKDKFIFKTFPKKKISPDNTLNNTNGTCWGCIKTGNRIVYACQKCTGHLNVLFSKGSSVGM